MKTEAGTYAVLEHFLRSYLTERNLEKTVACVTDIIHCIGTGKCVMASNKVEFNKLIAEDIAMNPEPIEFSIGKYWEDQIGIDVTTCVCDLSATTCDDKKIPLTMVMRLTAVICKEEEAYKIVSFHMSTANDFQEDDEFFPVKYGLTKQANMNISEQKKIVQLMSNMIPGEIGRAHV